MFEFLFNATCLVSKYRGEKRKPFTGLFLAAGEQNRRKRERRSREEENRDREEERLTLICPSALPFSAAEKRNDSFTPRHFRFLLSATVLTARASIISELRRVFSPV